MTLKQRLDRTMFYDYSPLSRSPRASPETSLRRSGMRRLCTWLVTKSPGASGHCPPPLREAALKARRGRASGGKPRKQGSQMMPVHKRKTVRGQACRVWSAERRTSPLGREAPRKRRGPTLLARSRVPRKHPSACRRSAPSHVRGETNKPRRSMCLARRMTLAQFISVILRCETEGRASKDDGHDPSRASFEARCARTSG
jgi:hypothetical protein